MIAIEKIKDIVEKKFKGSEKFLVEAAVKPGNKIIVVIDSDKNISIDDCAEISRLIESHIDRETEDFELEVTSAGLDHPFVSMRQYKKYINKMVDVTTFDGLKTTGVLLAVDDQHIKLEQKLDKKALREGQNSLVTIPFSEIKETKPVILFK